MAKNLTIIIVSFNSSKIISSCLEKIDFSKYEVMVVDNASTDTTVQIVADKFPLVQIIKLDKNIGYGRANNVALRLVATEFALVLNPDAFILSEEIEKILTVLQKSPEIALAGPLLLQNYTASPAEREKQLEIVYSNLLEKFDNYLSVKYIIGAILFLRMSVFKQIGFFDEEIFLYYEDDEISWRTVKNGYKAAIFPDAIGFHIGQGSSGGSLRSIYKRFWHRALSKLYWKKKQKGAFAAVKSAIRLTIVFVLKSLFYAVTFNSKKAVENFASCCGSAAFLIGLKAFDKNDNSRA
ncbi:MAG: glycosyltransferase family 2 protein [Rickettsiaceae bacterium]|nr:glycosyltransferase family 2 protein [Rickettsiaceae bacterium]